VDARLRGRVLLAQVTTKTYTFTQSFAGWPDWLVVAVATISLALMIWVAIKVLKWALWLLFFLVLLGGFGWVAWLLIR
jgi:hypothetical protein